MNCIWILLLLCCCGQNGCGSNENRRINDDCGCNNTGRYGCQRGTGVSPGPVIPPRRPLPPFSPEGVCGCESCEGDSL